MRGESTKHAFKNRLEALGEGADAQRLRLALMGAKASAFDWTLADDRIRWDGGPAALRHHPDLERLTSGVALQTWLGPHARGRLLGLVDEVSPADPSFTMEFEASTNASREWFEISGVRTPGTEGRAERVTGVVREITQQKQAFTRLSYLATRDELTGHLNRTRLREELSRVILRATGEGRSCAYVVAAIDDLAVINETYGFDVADEVIVATGQRLAQALRTSDVIGRTAGNKFGLILGECGEREMAVVGERLHAAVHGEIIETRAGSVSASVSVGAVWLPRGASNSQEAMLRAEEALEQAKGTGRSGFAMYTISAQRESARRRLIAIGDEVMEALTDHRLILAYQPIVGAVSRRAEHHECLLRLQRKDGTIAPAGEFIPAAETLGLVRLLDRRALEMAVAQLYRHPDIKLSINVSGTTAGDHSWLQSFINYVRENRAVAERITVELTETAALQGFEENARFVTRLRDMGCRVAIDDFGAGFTSFRNLHNLRVDIVKIDGAYVKNLSESPDNQLFVRTLVDLAKNFQLETVAEWVGSEEDAQILAGYGVDYFQGFFFGQPDIAPAWAKTGLVAAQ
ncbi:MAG TPA: bifunctional diguanylate cyclase/phosphodiesterase [Micropepsaceae bacterium]|nr:bifunctional diguanylate cyclase/phosphodiesterase [Micropepsaceae bacterium]